MSHASSSKICKYDVFLSFRGEDIRRTFVSHLYNALNQRGIPTFKDDERLETGKSISCELLKAIEESRFAVVIFSKKYASSRWCLDELAHIVKCKNELEQIVIPVFYDVSPSDVRHQYPPFAKSFSKHEKTFKDDLEKVQRWRDAFAGAGKLSGYHLQNFKDEADCIKKLVDDIFPKSLQVISPFPESLVGMKSQVEKVTSLLDMESNDVRSVGIWGMGGIGKTEIASVLYQRYRHRFEADCFLGGVGTLYQKNGLTWLAEVVIGKLLGEKMTITSEHEGLNILKNRLCLKKVLFILDDVNHRQQLDFLVGGPEWFGMGSRIILTGRDKHLLISHVGDNVYEVQLLSEDEALELFSRHAFREKTPKKDFMELSREVVQYAGGLPLALKVLGSSFYGRDKKHWRDIIYRLERIPHNDILGKLRLSFDGLDKDEKEIFLDIAFLDIALREDIFNLYVKLLLDSRGFRLIIDYLIEKSLLSNIHNSIVMHNMIREMGANVIREEYANSRIWLPEEVGDLFKGKLITEKVECLCIPEGYNFEDDPVNYSNIFKRMQSLQVLIINDETFSSDCAITYLPPRLLFIMWPKYPSNSLPESFEPSELIMLHLESSRLVELFPISKKLTNLKHLDLSFSHVLTKTPNFGDTPNLETLILLGCENLEEVHPSLGHCTRLITLDLTDCKKLKKLPKFVCMESLEALNLCECTSLEEFPETCGDMPRLRTLILQGCENLEELHPSLGHCTRLITLSLWDCKKLKKLPKFDCMESLEDLYLCGCTSLEEFPETCGDMPRLRALYVESPWIRSLPPSLSSLRDLELIGCEVLEMLPNSLFESCQLEKLRIDRCSGLVELPISLGVQKKLRRLEINRCENLKKLPSSIQMESITNIFISNCPKLDTFPEINGDMHSLFVLTIEFTGIKELPSSIGNLSGLTEFHLEGCEDLVSLPNSLCNLMNLESLFLCGCKKLEKLPENIKLGKLTHLNFSHEQQFQHSSSFVLHQVSGLSSLESLDLRNHRILGGLPEDLGSLQSLKWLDVSGSNISCLPKSIKELLNLWHLNVQFCQNLNELRGELPPNLKDLAADYHLALKSIRGLVIKCLNLRLLSISWYGHEKSKYGTATTCQVNALKFIQHFLRTCIQCDFHRRDYFLIFFPEVKIPELFKDQIVNQKVISIDLNPSWYTEKFMGFSICYCESEPSVSLVATLVCKSDPERKHSLKCDIYGYGLDLFSGMIFIYIPFKTLWHASDNEEGKNPNDYYLFEVSTMIKEESCWGIRLEYENKDRKQRATQTQSPELFPVPQKDNAVTTEIGCSMVLEQPEPSHTSSWQASADHYIAPDRRLHWGNENKDIEVDQAAMAVQKEHECQNVELTRVCDSPSRKIGDASRNRKRKRNRKKKRKIGGIDETSCSHCTN